jgi:hypothetical protein
MRISASADAAAAGAIVDPAAESGSGVYFVYCSSNRQLLL